MLGVQVESALGAWRLGLLLRLLTTDEKHVNATLAENGLGNGEPEIPAARSSRAAPQSRSVVAPTRKTGSKPLESLKMDSKGPTPGSGGAVIACGSSDLGQVGALARNSQARPDRGRRVGHQRRRREEPEGPDVANQGAWAPAVFLDRRTPGLFAPGGARDDGVSYPASGSGFE